MITGRQAFAASWFLNRANKRQPFYWFATASSSSAPDKIILQAARLDVFHKVLSFFEACNRDLDNSGAVTIDDLEMSAPKISYLIERSVDVSRAEDVWQEEMNYFISQVQFVDLLKGDIL